MLEDGFIVPFGINFKRISLTAKNPAPVSAKALTIQMLILIVGIFFLGSAAANAGSGGNSFSRRGPPVTVLTQNVYVGANLEILFDVDPEDIPIAVMNVLKMIEDSNYAERAAALADEIARKKPDLIGLQEVTLIRIQSPGDFLAGNPQPAEIILLDYLQILMDALVDRGLDYETAATVENVDVELPMLAGFDVDGTPLFDDVRLTDMDVILKKAKVNTSNVTTGNYNVNLQVPLGNIDIEIKRGFTAVDAEVRGRSYRFVNTHLEGVRAGDVPIPEIQAAQALELIEELRDEKLPVIVVGDFNSSPQDPIVFDPVLILTPYWLFRIAGYADAWQGSPSAHNDPGFTCCQADDLMNEESELDERIDHIFIHNQPNRLFFSIMGPVSAAIVGDEPKDKTPSGLWLSDHAGMLAKLRIPALK